MLARRELLGDAEDRMDELALREGIALRDPVDLTFADRMHRLVAGYRPASTLHRPESEARSNPLLDEAMVLPLSKRVSLQVILVRPGSLKEGEDGK